MVAPFSKFYGKSLVGFCLNIGKRIFLRGLILKATERAYCKVHDGKVMPLYLIKKYPGKNCKFHYNLRIKKSLIEGFLVLYQEIFQKWSKFLSACVSISSTIMSKFL